MTKTQTRKKSIIICSIILLLTSFLVPLASCTITLNYPLRLGYGNGTYTMINPGVHSNITRINGVWWVDGNPYPKTNLPDTGTIPSSGSEPTPSAEPTTTQNTPNPTGSTPHPSENPIITTIKENPLIVYFIVGVVFLFLFASAFMLTTKKARHGKASIKWKPY